MLAISIDPAVMASAPTDMINMMIAVLTLTGLVCGALWKLRQLLKNDMESITAKHVEPLSASVKSLNQTVSKHDETLYGDGGVREQLAYLKGKADQQAETASTVNAAATIGSALLHPPEQGG